MTVDLPHHTTLFPLFQSIFKPPPRPMFMTLCLPIVTPLTLSLCLCTGEGNVVAEAGKYRGSCIPGPRATQGL